MQIKSLYYESFVVKQEFGQKDEVPPCIFKSRTNVLESGQQTNPNKLMHVYICARVYVYLYVCIFKHSTTMSLGISIK